MQEIFNPEWGIQYEYHPVFFFYLITLLAKKEIYPNDLRCRPVKFFPSLCSCLTRHKINSVDLCTSIKKKKMVPACRAPTSISTKTEFSFLICQTLFFVEDFNWMLTGTQMLSVTSVNKGLEC